MADWLILLLKYGGFGAVLLLALWIMGGWLLKRINAALDSYTTAYLQQKAGIDARIANLEKLAEEQARLTRTVESIKDEIAAQAKSRDNKWAFKKDVYVRLITSTGELLRFYLEVGRRGLADGSASEDVRAKSKEEFSAMTDRLMTDFCLARLATANNVIAVIDKLEAELRAIADRNPFSVETVQQKLLIYQNFRNLLCIAGREDLWPTPETEPRAEAATHA
jgi:hypothetical protein